MAQDGQNGANMQRTEQSNEGLVMMPVCHNCRWWIRIESTPMGSCHRDPFMMTAAGERATCNQWERETISFDTVVEEETNQADNRQNGE